MYQYIRKNNTNEFSIPQNIEQLHDLDLLILASKNPDTIPEEKIKKLFWLAKLLKNTTFESMLFPAAKRYQKIIKVEIKEKQKNGIIIRDNFTSQQQKAAAQD
jgi:hypothetical protein